MPPRAWCRCRSQTNAAERFAAAGKPIRGCRGPRRNLPAPRPRERQPPCRRRSSKCRLVEIRTAGRWPFCADRGRRPASGFARRRALGIRCRTGRSKVERDAAPNPSTVTRGQSSRRSPRGPAAAHTMEPPARAKDLAEAKEGMSARWRDFPGSSPASARAGAPTDPDARAEGHVAPNRAAPAMALATADGHGRRVATQRAPANRRREAGDAAPVSVAPRQAGHDRTGGARAGGHGLAPAGSGPDMAGRDVGGPAALPAPTLLPPQAGNSSPYSNAAGTADATANSGPPRYPPLRKADTTSTGSPTQGTGGGCDSAPPNRYQLQPATELRTHRCQSPSPAETASVVLKRRIRG